MRVITGYLRPSAGRVLVDGVDVVADPVGARLRVGYVPESSAVPGELTVVAFLRYCARLRRVPRPQRKAAVGRALGQAGLARVANARIGTLSRGFRQRVALAQALVHDPPVLVLDEPTSGLDPRQVTESRDLIARLGRRRAVLLSSHLLSEVSQLCRRVVVLDRGRVLAVSDVATLTAATGILRLELRLTGDLEQAAGLLAHVEGVAETAVRGGLVVVRGEGDELGPRVSAAVVAAGIGLLELRATSDTLEEAYLRLVRE